MNEKTKCGVHVQMEYYSALEKDIMAHAVTWVNLEDIVLSEIRQIKRTKTCMIPLIRDT